MFSNSPMVFLILCLPFIGNIGGRVRTKTVKKAAKIIIEKYYTRLTLDFDTNKRICEEIAIIPTKPLRNKIAGENSMWPQRGAVQVEMKGGTIKCGFLRLCGTNCELGCSPRRDEFAPILREIISKL